jgi:ABC-type uncharacterized transport system involved in gliding motility auxiliary subunit
MEANTNPPQLKAVQMSQLQSIAAKYNQKLDLQSSQSMTINSQSISQL